MGHELDFTTGDAAIAYRGDTPWHGYGFVMPENASTTDWLREARLNWHVDRRPVYTSLEDSGQPVAVQNMRALVRSDNGKVLSVVGDRYKVVQPREIMEFFQDLVSDYGFEIETAGALAEGRRVWALAKTGKEFDLGNDPLRAYLLLATSYDKQFATTAQFTSIRVVCQNTLGFSLSEGERQESRNVIRVPHMSEFNAENVKGNLGLLGPSWNQFTSDVERLANTKITKQQAIEFFMELFGYDNDEETSYEEAQKTYLVKETMESYTSAPGQQLESARDTLWGVVNAVTHFADHTRRARDNGTRVNSAFFGESSNLKKKAFDKALEAA